MRISRTDIYLKSARENLKKKKIRKFIKTLSSTHAPEHILPDSDEPQDKAAVVSLNNKHEFLVGAVFDSSKANTSVLCSFTTATDGNLGLFDIKPFSVAGGCKALKGLTTKILQVWKIRNLLSQRWEKIL